MVLTRTSTRSCRNRRACHYSPGVVRRSRAARADRLVAAAASAAATAAAGSAALQLMLLL